MKVICVDDEKLILDLTMSMLRSIDRVDEVDGFTDAESALEYFDYDTADIAMLDIDMPGMNGITLAMKIKEKRPDVIIIFLTGYSEYSVEAFAIHASGYVLKPTNVTRLEEEINYAMLQKSFFLDSGFVADEKKEVPHIQIKTFGNFDVLVDGEAVSFSRSKSKELLAYLVDRQGGSVTRAEVFALLWEDGMYDRPMQKQLDVIIRALKATLDKYEISEMLEIQRGSMRLVVDKVDCDLYRLLSGDINAINSYRGEYMSAYEWASLTEGYVTRNLSD